MSYFNIQQIESIYRDRSFCLPFINTGSGFKLSCLQSFDKTHLLNAHKRHSKVLFLKILQPLWGNFTRKFGIQSFVIFSLVSILFKGMKCFSIYVIKMKCSNRRQKSFFSANAKKIKCFQNIYSSKIRIKLEITDLNACSGVPLIRSTTALKKGSLNKKMTD